jgi:hypothetical protein
VKWGPEGINGTPEDVVAPYNAPPPDDLCNPNPIASGDRGCAATDIDSAGDVIGFIGGDAKATAEQPIIHLPHESGFQILPGGSAVPLSVARRPGSEPKSTSARTAPTVSTLATAFGRLDQIRAHARRAQPLGQGLSPG